MANNPVVNTLTFTGSVAGQATIQAQGIAGGLSFLLPNTAPILGQLLNVAAVNGDNVFLGWASPVSTLSFSDITGSLSLSQIGQNGASTGQSIEWNGTAWVPVSALPGEGTVTRVATAGIATGGPITSIGTVTVLGSGSTNLAATALTSLSSAPSGDVLTADGSGNVQDSGTLLSSLATTAALAGYLPLTGGTISGGLQINDGSTASSFGSSAISLSGPNNTNITIGPNMSISGGTDGVVISDTSSNGIAITENTGAIQLAAPNGIGLTVGTSSVSITNSGQINIGTSASIIALGNTGGEISINATGSTNINATGSQTFSVTTSGGGISLSGSPVSILPASSVGVALTVQGSGNGGDIADFNLDSSAPAVQITDSGVLHLYFGLEDNDSSTGTSGQVLTAGTGGQVVWATPSSGSGTVNSGTAGHLSYYATTGNAVSDSGIPATTVSAGGGTLLVQAASLQGIGSVIPTYDGGASTAGDIVTFNSGGTLTDSGTPISSLVTASFNGTFTGANPTFSGSVTFSDSGTSITADGAIQAKSINSIGAVGGFQILDSSAGGLNLVEDGASSIGITANNGGVSITGTTGISLSGPSSSSITLGSTGAVELTSSATNGLVLQTPSSSGQIVTVTGDGGVNVTGTSGNITLTSPVAGSTNLAGGVLNLTSVAFANLGTLTGAGAGSLVYCSDANGSQDSGTTWGSQASNTSPSNPGTGAVLKYTGSIWVVIG